MVTYYDDDENHCDDRANDVPYVGLLILHLKERRYLCRTILSIVTMTYISIFNLTRLQNCPFTTHGSLLKPTTHDSLTGTDFKDELIILIIL